MFRYRHAAAFLVGTFLIFPTLSSAQEASIPGLDLPSFDLSVAVDVPDVGAHVPEFTDFNDSDPGIASGISEALVTTAAGIIEPLDPDDDGDVVSNVSKMLHDTAMAIIRKIGGIAPDPAQYGDPKEDIEKTISAAIEAARPKVKEIVVVGSKVKEEVESRLQQGRLILDSDLEAAAKKGNLMPNPKEQVDETLERMNKGDLINKLQDTALAIIRKIGGIAPDPAQFGDPIPDVDTFPF